MRLMLTILTGVGALSPGQWLWVFFKKVQKDILISGKATTQQIDNSLRPAVCRLACGKAGLGVPGACQPVLSRKFQVRTQESPQQECATGAQEPQVLRLIQSYHIRMREKKALPSARHIVSLDLVSI